MDLFELKREQTRLAHKIQRRDSFSRINTIGGINCVAMGENIIATVVVCEYPSMKLLEKQSYIFSDPLPYRMGFLAYREMPAMIEAVNLLEKEPDVLLVNGPGMNHPRKIGIASHLGLALNIPTIGVTQKLNLGKVENGKIIAHNEIVGFEITTREHANPIYVSPGHLITLGSTLNLIPSTIQFPHKLPEPLHIAHKVGKKKVRKLVVEV
jgi:deoxyribonuclease V